MSLGAHSDYPAVEKLIHYFDDSLRSFGPTARGVDWRDHDGHFGRLRWGINQLRLKPNDRVLDFGCGYGALYGLLLERGLDAVQYHGYDINETMLATARELFKDFSNATFSNEIPSGYLCDYSVAIGTFHVKADSSDAEFDSIVVESLRTMAKISQKGWIASFLCWPSADFRVKEHLRYYRAHELTTMLDDIGKLKVVENPGFHEFALVMEDQ